MKVQEFQKQLDRVIKQFGPNHYSEERAELIWNAMSVFSEKQFKCIVDVLIADCKFAPVRKDFIEASKFFSESRGSYLDEELAKRRQSVALCNKCGNTGSVYAESISTSYTCVFRCGCEFGRAKLAKGYREYNSSTDSDWRIIPYDDSETKPVVIKTLNAFTGLPMPGADSIDQSARDALVAQAKKHAAKFDQMELDAHEF